MNKKEKGITLIALVVTIVVLLILAAVSISTLTGENGIITQAKKAKTLTKEKEKEEEEELYNLESKINELLTGEVEAPKVEDDNPGVLDGDGTETKPYEINCIEDLVAFSKQVNEGNNFSGKYIKLMRSLDFKSNNSYINPETQEFGDVNFDGKTEGLKIELSSGQGFIPIGNYNSDPLPFSGTFYGNKNYIRNLYVNVVQENGEFDAGLFGYNTGTIQEVYVLNCNIYAENTFVSAGGICGVQEGNVLRCVSSGKIVAKAKGENSGMIVVGGIAGQSTVEGENALTESCYNLAEVQGINLIEKYNENTYGNVCVGGIIAVTSLDNHIVSNCYNRGNIKGNGNQGISVGGIVARVGVTSNIEFIGGSGESLFSYGGKVKNCYNIGTINGTINGNEVENSYLVGIGSAIGTVLGKTKISNVYGINNKEVIGWEIEEEGYENVITNVEEKTSAELKSDEMLLILDSGFKKDIGINEGYPILSWQ